MLVLCNEDYDRLSFASRSLESSSNDHPFIEYRKVFRAGLSCIPNIFTKHWELVTEMI